MSCRFELRPCSSRVHAGSVGKRFPSCRRAGDRKPRSARRVLPNASRALLPTRCDRRLQLVGVDGTPFALPPYTPALCSISAFEPIVCRLLCSTGRPMDGRCDESATPMSLRVLAYPVRCADSLQRKGGCHRRLGRIPRPAPSALWSNEWEGCPAPAQKRGTARERGAERWTQLNSQYPSTFSNTQVRDGRSFIFCSQSECDLHTRSYTGYTTWHPVAREGEVRGYRCDRGGTHRRRYRPDEGAHARPAEV